MSTTERTEREIFDKAIEIETANERDAFIRRVCGDDSDLIERINALLHAHDQVDFLPDHPGDEEMTLPESTVSEDPGTIIGRYKLLEKIGEGGMAVVYMAKQERPIQRKVALKIIKLGMDTKSVITRFEAERQALAMMDHPNIAKVLDAGATETGRPYFVMDLVPGLSITEYCDKNRLNIKERLKLFITVCDAIQHAHQKGIIHRDIKPSNIIVTMHNGKPVPKAIDFGIAKATNQRLTEKTLFTRFAHIIGTPAYMSPEQAELSDLDVDTRTDIYSLGVLLYELLTGTTPFSEKKLREAGYLQMQKIICEEEPTKPSTKLSTLGEELTDIAKWYNSSPESLTKLVRGDLDWIVMKSLEKDRIRRYETANGLGEDIRRHLEHEPVLARGPSTTYRLQKFLRRHRSKTIATLFMFAIVGSLTVILSMWNRDRIQLVEAEGFRHRGILSQAREQYAEMDREAALETIKSILRSKHVGLEAQLLYAGILVDYRRSDEAVAVLEKLVNERPGIDGAAHSLWARMLWESESPSAEKLKEIEEHRQRAEALLPETAEAYFLRSMTAVTVKEKIAYLDKALQLDPGHYESRRLRAFTYYASRKYEKMQLDVEVMVTLKPKDPLGYSLRAIALRELDRYQEAIAGYDTAIALMPNDNPQYVDLSTQRCETLLRMGDYERAVTEAQKCLELSDSSPVFQYHIFCALTAIGDYEKADAMFRQIIAYSYEARHQFQDWCMKYVFDTLEAGRSWHPIDREPEGAAFLPMVEAEEIYNALSVKARRVTTDGFSADWSPDGKKLAFSMGVHGYSGVAIFDPATKQTELLIVPGKDPRWSPDGRYIAFVRDCRFLRVSEFIAAERKSQHRWLSDEEVWIMNADGTEARSLARGGWPSWSQDSTCIFYHSRVNSTLCSISIESSDAKPKQIMACLSSYPSVSLDNQRVAYLEGTSLKAIDLDSQTPVAEWPVPPNTWSEPRWSPTDDELCMGGSNDLEKGTGLWFFRLDRSEPAKTLVGQITVGSWAPDGRKLVFSLGPPYFEIWCAELDPNVSAIEALGPARTLDEHYQEMIALYTRRIESDPEDAYAYSGRARYYDCLHDRDKVDADMRHWSAILSSGLSSDLQVVKPPADADFTIGTLKNLGPTVNSSAADALPSITADGLTLYFSSNRSGGYGGDGDLWVTTRVTTEGDWGSPVNLGPTVNTTHWEFSQSISADGLTLYFSSNQPGGSGSFDLWITRRSPLDDNWSTPVNLGSMVNSSGYDWSPSISADGLMLYFSSNRSGGCGGDGDLWVTTRATTNDFWGSPANLGPTVNSPYGDATPNITADGRTLFFHSTRPGGYGGWDTWVTTRESTNAEWSAPANLGPPVNSSYNDGDPCISADGSTLFFWSTRPDGIGDDDIWQVSITPVSGSFQKYDDASLVQKSVESSDEKEVVSGKNQ